MTRLSPLRLWRLGLGRATRMDDPGWGWVALLLALAVAAVLIRGCER